MGNEKNDITQKRAKVRARGENFKVGGGGLKRTRKRKLPGGRAGGMPLRKITNVSRLKCAENQA